MYARELPFGEAHRIVGAAVRRALQAGRDRDGIDASTLDAAAVEVTGRHSACPIRMYRTRSTRSRLWRAGPG